MEIFQIKFENQGRLVCFNTRLTFVGVKPRIKYGDTVEIAGGDGDHVIVQWLKQDSLKCSDFRRESNAIHVHVHVGERASGGMVRLSREDKVFECSFQRIGATPSGCLKLISENYVKLSYSINLQIP